MAGGVPDVHGGACGGIPYHQHHGQLDDEPFLPVLGTYNALLGDGGYRDHPGFHGGWGGCVDRVEQSAPAAVCGYAEEMTFYDRVYGSLAGLALGDALGMPTEFLSPEQIAAEFGWVDHPVKAPQWHFHQIMQPGQITDDTGQTLAIAHAYSADGKLTTAAVARELLKWADSQGKFLDQVLGPSTKAALEALRRGEDPEKTGINGKTNGASYRAVVIGLVNHTQREQLIQDVVTACLPTHGTTAAISGAMAVAMAVAEACQVKASLKSILAAGMQGAVEGRKHGAWAWNTPLEKRIEQAERVVNENSEPKAALKALHDFVGVDITVSESVASAFGVVAPGARRSDESSGIRCQHRRRHRHHCCHRRSDLWRLERHSCHRWGDAFDRRASEWVEPSR